MAKLKPLLGRKVPLWLRYGNPIDPLQGAYEGSKDAVSGFFPPS